jgi:hypothetical protein
MRPGSDGWITGFADGWDISTLVRVTVSQVTPAGRLHRLLSEIREKPSSQNIVQAWGEVLGISPNHRAELLRMYSFVVALPDEVTAAVGKVDHTKYNTSLAMRWRDKVVHAFEVDFSGAVPVPHFTERYDRETLAHLEWCDDLLCRGLPGRSAPQQRDLERITVLVTELERDLSGDPEIDPELRAFLLQHAQAMAQAVRDVPVRGTAGLEEALDRATGDFYIRRPHLAARADPARAQMFLAIVSAVLLALQCVLTSVQIAYASDGTPSSYVTVEIQGTCLPALPALPAVPALPAPRPASPSPLELVSGSDAH